MKLSYLFVLFMFLGQFAQAAVVEGNVSVGNLYTFLRQHGTTDGVAREGSSYSVTYSGYFLISKNDGSVSFKTKLEKAPWETREPKQIQVNDEDLVNIFKRDLENLKWTPNYSYSDTAAVRVDCTMKTVRSPLNTDSAADGYVCQFWGDFAE